MTNPIIQEDLAAIRAQINPENFADSTILLTGCAGFLGYYKLQFLTHYASELGIRRIIGLDNFKLGRPEWLSEMCDTQSDILELQTFDIATDSLDTVAGADAVTHVIHMASIASPMFYRQFPVETVDGNIWGLRRLLDFYKNSDALRGLLFFSSSEIYGDPDADQIPTPESYRGNVACVGPRACYDESKRFGETLCYIFAKTHDMPITVARPFNNFGPGMRIGDKRLPADLANCILEQRDIVIHSDGRPTRTFCYISDAIAGYFKCLQYGKFDSFNIGIETPEISVRELAAIYQSASQEIFDFKPQITFVESEDKEYLVDNPNRRCPDITKARDLLRYDPSVKVEDGVRRYLQFLRHEKG